MHPLISKYIQWFGYQLTIGDKSRASVTIMAHLFGGHGHSIVGYGLTPEEALSDLAQKLIAEDSK
jgi:hypothetical protein